MQWNCNAVTDPGKVRKLNEDSIYHSDDQQIWAVADGMGGHHRGDLASQTIVKYLQSYSATHHGGISLHRLVNLLQIANTELVNKASQEDTGIIASTCAILSRRKHSIVCSWVGDSRIYRFRNNELVQLTRDHSYETVIEDLRISGETVEDILVDTQTLTRGVGAEAELQVEHCHFIPQNNDRYLLCTDGLYKEVPNPEIERRYASTPCDKELMDQLHQAYLDGGARDNLGLILLTAT